MVIGESSKRHTGLELFHLSPYAWLEISPKRKQNITSFTNLHLFFFFWVKQLHIVQNSSSRIISGASSPGGVMSIVF